MDANAFPLLTIFEKKSRLEVPLFQRQYVWNQNHQWEPLWEDIRRKFTEYLVGRKNAPEHFLGAMVLDQKQAPAGHVERRQIIDGQQRLTTLQIFLAAFRDFCRKEGYDDLANECESFTLNKGMMADPSVDKFKVWPTQSDRSQFIDVMTLGSCDAVEAKHPLIRRKYTRKFEPRPRMVEAYFFFYGQLAEFFLGANAEPPIAAEHPLRHRLDECFQALKGALLVVEIDLKQDDDAQVIFETLNARGEPLLPADLLRNYIFLRAARRGEPQEALYEEFWKPFDEPFWRQEIRQGRLSRPRSDLFMQHFLASRQAVDIPVKHLFIEYKFWIERERPFPSVRAELSTLAMQREHFRRIVEPKRDDVIYELVTFLNCYDIGTSYPLLLALLDAELPDPEWHRISTTLESYILRRAVCGLTTKNYNRVFLTLIRSLKREGLSAANLERHLSELSGDSVEWPSDEVFQLAWATRHAYQTLNNVRIVHILRRLSDVYAQAKTETIKIESPLTVEHILPANWLEHWPLPDGTKGMTSLELLTSDSNDPRAKATQHRNSLVQTLGNLTILSQSLNSAISNSPWEIKKPELLRYSLLPINLQLHDIAVWDEAAIERRSKALFVNARGIWLRPARLSA